MIYGDVSFNRRLKEDIKDYKLSNLFQMKELKEFLKCTATLANISLLLTERHGEKAIVIGDYVFQDPDVVANPGRKLRVHGRTVGHLYVINQNERPDRRENAEEFMDALIAELEVHATEAYEKAEYATYVDDLEELADIDQEQAPHGDNEDKLTGALSKIYFNTKVQALEQAETVPVAVICININDWKVVNDKHGDAESDRLIKTIGGIVLKKAKKSYVIGRVDGDVFAVLIPMAEDGEAERYIESVQKACEDFEDDKIAPSVACGFVMRTNVEQKLRDIYSDAEYEMFQNKFEIKNSASYQTRLARIK